MPLVVTSADITAALVRTDAAADNIDQAVDACPTLDELTRTQWKRWLVAYRRFSVENKNLSFFTFGLPSIGDQAVAYEHEIGTWNGTVASKCHNPQPSPVTHDDIAARNAATLGASIPSVDGSTKVLIGAALALGLLIALRK